MYQYTPTLADVKESEHELNDESSDEED